MRFFCAINRYFTWQKIISTKHNNKQTCLSKIHNRANERSRSWGINVWAYVRLGTWRTICFSSNSSIKWGKILQMDVNNSRSIAAETRVSFLRIRGMQWCLVWWNRNNTATWYDLHILWHKKRKQNWKIFNFPMYAVEWNTYYTDYDWLRNSETYDEIYFFAVAMGMLFLLRTKHKHNSNREYQLFTSWNVWILMLFSVDLWRRTSALFLRRIYGQYGGIVVQP